MGHGTPVAIRSRDAYERWEQANVVRGESKGTVSAYAWARLGDITSDQFRSLASFQREFGADVRVTNRQNLVFRGLSESQLRTLFDRLSAIGMAEPGAELSRDVVACPGADTCNLAVTQSRGLADAIGVALDEAGLAEVGGIRTNISGCTNSCGQHHIADIGFFGAERRAHGRSAPGYQLLLGGYVGEEQIHFGEKALRLPAKTAPQAAVRVVGRFAAEREAGESFRSWMERAGGAKAIADTMADLAEFPDPERRTRVLRRLRRDRPLRGGHRRLGVRDMSPLAAGRRLMFLEPAPTATVLSFDDDELAELNAEFEKLPASKIIQWAVDSFAPHLSLSASMQDAVLIDLATKVDPAHRGRVHRHRLPLPRDAGDGRGRAAPVRAEPEDHDGAALRRGPVAHRPGELLLVGEGRPARPRPRRQGGVDVGPAPIGGRRRGREPRSSGATCAGSSR